MATMRLPRISIDHGVIWTCSDRLTDTDTQGAGQTAMFLTWSRPGKPDVVYVRAAVDCISDYDMPEWIPLLLDDPFENWRRCKPCGPQLLPEDQVRVIGYQATPCFHCARTALNLEALGDNSVRVDVSLELLRKLRDGQVYDEDCLFMLADGCLLE